MTTTFKAKIECRDCGGSGLYVGMAERNGAAVVCRTCDGSGCEDFELKYVPFIKRKRKNGITRVFAKSCGYVHSGKDEKMAGDICKIVKFSQGGATYAEWVNGAKLLPVQDLYCPYSWTDQNLQNKEHPQHLFYTKRCEEVGLGCFISECKYWGRKSECWRAFRALGGE